MRSTSKNDITFSVNKDGDNNRFWAGNYKVVCKKGEDFQWGPADFTFQLVDMTFEADPSMDGTHVFIINWAVASKDIMKPIEIAGPEVPDAGRDFMIGEDFTLDDLNKQLAPLLTFDRADANLMLEMVKHLGGPDITIG
ncbi:MAG: hypothetical protein JKY52_00205 [Flavobacteriales bacterium]|nr:hypothetical protein [Flavobacteriales bacterium]